jgi:hypothetical protein
MEIRDILHWRRGSRAPPFYTGKVCGTTSFV